MHLDSNRASILVIFQCCLTIALDLLCLTETPSIACMYRTNCVHRYLRMKMDCPDIGSLSGQYCARMISRYRLRCSVYVISRRCTYLPTRCMVQAALDDILGSCRIEELGNLLEAYFVSLRNRSEVTESTQKRWYAGMSFVKDVVLRLTKSGTAIGKQLMTYLLCCLWVGCSETS